MRSGHRVSIGERSVQDNRPGLVTEADWVPSFWNFLLKLDRADLIAELIQNDLDEGATRTVISFERDRLVCEGNGRPVDTAGWRRLRSIQGAGDQVAAKSRKIGVKNHGLKTAFTIGDEIRLSSAGRSIIQTLYARGSGKAPRPGASAVPEPDPDAPDDGCRVVITYRTIDVEPPVGEAIRLGAVDTDDIDDLFACACAATPEQFAGIVSPDFARRYEVVIRHWKSGEARFLFSSSRPRRVRKRVEVFRRSCVVSGTVSGLPDNLQEEVARRLLPLRGRLRERAADFFRRGARGDRYLVEVSWPVNARGRPRAGTGRFRYPIGYPGTSEEARTGLGAFFNAPIVSDTQRHGPATNDPTNAELRDACESLLVDALVNHVLPRWGASGLSPLVPTTPSDTAVVRPLLAVLAARGAVPTVGRDEALELLSRRPSKRRQAGRLRFPASSRRRRRYRFVVPVAQWTTRGVEPALAAICPASERQVDPRIPEDIIRLLASPETKGYGEHFVDFTEDDVFHALTGAGSEHFNHVGPLTTELANPLFASACLDVIRTALREGAYESTAEDELLAGISLPDSFCTARPFDELYTGASVPPDIPGLRIPPFLHDDVASHPLLRRRKWHRPVYTFREFLDVGALAQAGEVTRRRFWEWIRRNGSSVPLAQRRRLADIPIWPDVDHCLCTLGDLCEPRSHRIAAILAEAISRPHEHVRRSRLVTARGGRPMSLRRTPTDAETADWLECRLHALTDAERPERETMKALRKLHSDLAILLKDAAVARGFRANVALPALAQDGSLQRREGLVEPSRSVNRLALSKRFLLKRTRHDRSLNVLCKPLSEPMAEMLLATFDADPANSKALQARLEQFEAATTDRLWMRDWLTDKAIVPVNGGFRAPSELAFKGGSGDYWGEWKVRVSPRGLSQEDQRRYRMVGVTSSRPNLETSQRFFEWLSGQGRDVVERHISCVLRHVLLHGAGLYQWAERHPDTEFLPVEGRDGPRLASWQMVRNGQVFLRDARDLAKMVTTSDPRVLVAIDRTKAVRRPASEVLRLLGVPSLREALGRPRRVLSHGAESPAPDDVHHALKRLRSSRFQQTFLKGLGGLGIDTGLVWRDWPTRLSRIEAVRVADGAIAEYRLRGRSYAMEVDAGLDEKTGVCWVKRDRRGLRGMYRALAAQLVFKRAARPVDLIGLEVVLEAEVDDPSYGRPGSESPAAGDGHAGEEWSEDDDRGDDDESELGEAVSGHAPFTPDPSRNVPSPGPIPGSAGADAPGNERHRVAPAKKTVAGGGSAAPTPQLESVQVNDLKANQYAFHCQMCLCARSPEELAPVGSYIESAEIRRRVIDAHHVDSKSAGGDRHAGNLILLCRLHHENYGRRLTRGAVLAALKRKHENRTVRFIGAQEHKEIAGEIIEIEISGKAGDRIQLFFTAPHANYWRSTAPDFIG